MLFPVLFVTVIHLMSYAQTTDTTENFKTYRLLRTVRITGNYMNDPPPLTSSSRSRVQCAVLCSLNANCSAAEWNPSDFSCQMYQPQNLQIVYPLTAGLSDTTVMIGDPLEIVMVKPEVPAEKFDYNEAEQVCQDLGGRLITLDEMLTAYDARWLHIGRCGYISTGSAFYILQHTVEGVGYEGINICHWDIYWNAYCFLPGYTGIS